MILATPNNSHHEPFSDTIFWTCTLKFVCRSQKSNCSKLAIDQQSNNDEKATNLAISLVDYGMDDEEEEEGEMDEEETKNELEMTNDDDNGIN